MGQPLEALLRPPVEWMTSISGGLIALLMLRYPQMFLLSKNSSPYFALFLALFSLYRFKQGHRVYRYQRNLKRMPTYTMTSKELPVSRNKLFLGKGFLWTTQHTQRLRDLDFNYNLHFKNTSRLYKWARNKEFSWEKRPLLKHLAALFKLDHALNPVRPYPPIGGEPCIHGASYHSSNGQ